MFMNQYQTELFNHYSISSLTWEVFKKYNKIDIKLLSDYSMYRAFERMKRAGLCGIVSMSYTIANKKCMTNYDKKLPSSYIMILIACTLIYYGIM